MKKLLLVLSLALPAALSTSCESAPSARVVQVQTLKSVGQAADAALALSAQLYRDRRITAAEARSVSAFYDQRFQPAYRLAVSAVRANLDNLASPDVLALANELAAIVINLQNKR